MIIRSPDTPRPFPPSRETKPGDLLKTEPLQRPLMARLRMGEGLYDIESVDVETGAARIIVSGLPQKMHFSDFAEIEDWDGNKFDPETFYNEQ